MADIVPLTPLRYDLAHLPGGLGAAVAPPYDVIGTEERAALAARDPHNVVRLILPDGEGDARYANAAALLSEWRRAGVLCRDPESAFYRYDQTFVPPGGDTTMGAASRPQRAITRRGFLALVRLAPFAARVVLPHERTLSGPKEDRLKLFRATATNLSPGFMLYRDARGDLDAPLETGTVLTEFSTGDGVHHVLAKVTARDAVRAIIEGVSRSSLLIADGHHRYETALAYSKEVDGAHPGATARAEHRYFMTFLVNGDDPNLVVFPTHRHVHSLPSFSYDDLLTRAAPSFVVRALERGVDAASVCVELRRAAAAGSSVAVAAPDGRVALLTLRHDVDVASHPVEGREHPRPIVEPVREFGGERQVVHLEGRRIRIARDHKRRGRRAEIGRAEAEGVHPAPAGIDPRHVVGEPEVPLLAQLRDDRADHRRVVHEVDRGRRQPPGQEPFVAAAVVGEFVRHRPDDVEFVGELRMPGEEFAEVEAGDDRRNRLEEPAVFRGGPGLEVVGLHVRRPARQPDEDHRRIGFRPPRSPRRLGPEPQQVRQPQRPEGSDLEEAPPRDWA